MNSLTSDAMITIGRFDVTKSVKIETYSFKKASKTEVPDNIKYLIRVSDINEKH